MQDAMHRLFWHWLNNLVADTVYRKGKLFKKTVTNMKISLVITELEPGGAERNLVKLAIGLGSLGHDITVFRLGRVRTTKC